MSNSNQNADLEVAGFQLRKLYSITVDEATEYESLNNLHAQRSLELMLLGQRIAKEKQISYSETIAILNDLNQVEELLGDYLEEIQAIGLADYSVIRRKADIATILIRSRCDADWTTAQTGKLRLKDMEQLYDFFMGEMREWQDLDLPGDEDVGKSSLTSVPESKTPSTGKKSTTRSRQAESPTPDITPTTMGDS